MKLGKAGKLGLLLLALNEVRGVAVAATGFADLRAGGWRLGWEHLGALALIVVPIAGHRLWKAHKARKARNERIDRRLGL